MQRPLWPAARQSWPQPARTRVNKRYLSGQIKWQTSITTATIKIYIKPVKMSIFDRLVSDLNGHLYLSFFFLVKAQMFMIV